MRYIAETLGIEVCVEQWDGVDALPYFLIDRYDFKKAVLDGIPCIFMKPKGELDTLTAVKKHIAIVHEAEPLPVVLELERLPARRKQSLIEARIPFTATGCQIYLPFLGVALSERYTSVKTPSETFMPSTQLLFFHYLCQDEPEMRSGNAAAKFGFSAMQISRAVKQLTALDLMTARKDGVYTLISGIGNRRVLFERARPHLLNPARKKVYVESHELPDSLPLAGYSALSELTMLGDPPTTTVAFYGRVGDLPETDTLVDSTAQVEVEIWRYDPVVLSKHPSIVDTLSLIISLNLENDPRVEQAVDELLTGLWGEI